MINNSGFVSIKFNLNFFLISTLVIKWLTYINVLFQSLFYFKTLLTTFSKETKFSKLSRFYFSVMFCRRRDQTKQTLAVTLLFQCNFLLVVGADNLIWQFYFYFYRILSKWCWINTKVFIGFSIPSACTQTFPGIRRVNFIADK